MFTCFFKETHFFLQEHFHGNITWSISIRGNSVKILHFTSNSADWLDVRLFYDPDLQLLVFISVDRNRIISSRFIWCLLFATD